MKQNPITVTGHNLLAQCRNILQDETGEFVAITYTNHYEPAPECIVYFGDHYSPAVSETGEPQLLEGSRVYRRGIHQIAPAMPRSKFLELEARHRQKCADAGIKVTTASHPDRENAEQ